MKKSNFPSIPKIICYGVINLFFLLLSYQIHAKPDNKILTKDAYLLLDQIFSSHASDVQGIVANISGTGKVTISMFEYLPNVTDHKGALLYEVYVENTTINYQGKPYIIDHDKLQGLSPFIVGNWTTNDSKKSTLALAVKDNHLNNSSPQSLQNLFQHVLLEVRVENAEMISVKFPGFPPMNESFFGDHFIKVLDAIRNPLKYPDYTIVAAHRGYWEEVPENSLPAYDLTVQSGADMVELDTRRTKDNVLVAFHDACLDRITNGRGKLSEYTWDQIKDLRLKDRFGNLTNYHIVRINDALMYLKGRALVNLDIKEQILKDPTTGQVVDQLTPTFKAALDLAKQTGTLNQLVVKGKFQIDELQEILDEQGLTLADFTYTPVAFGWDTKNMNRYVSDWLEENINGIELTYKVAYDPILAQVPKAVNKNIRVGIYTMWPEDINGVIAEDKINDPLAYCTPNYREYNFLNENFYGEIPTNSNQADIGGSGPPVLPDDQDYGGGTADYLSMKPKTKTARPDQTNDGRGDWDWLFERGADFVITDRPVLMIQYLEALGKRKLEEPAITEITLPECAEISNGTGGTKNVINLRGLVRRINNFDLVDFFTPDTRQIPIDTNLVIDKYSEFSNGKNKQWVRDFAKKNGRPCNCGDLFAGSNGASKRQFPLHTLPEWSEIFPGYDLYINANWFDVRSLNDKFIEKSMYKQPCTNVFGWWQGLTKQSQPLGTLLTQNDPKDPQDDWDALMYTTQGNFKLVESGKIEQVFNDKSDPSKLCTSGYIIARNGVPIAYDKLPVGSSKTVVKKRSIIGLNGKEVFFAEFQTPQLLPYQVADLMTKYFNCKDVFMFDAGGSSTMLSSRGMFPSIPVEAGPYISSGSAPEDKDLDEERVYRPVPNFFAIKVKQ